MRRRWPHELKPALVAVLVALVLTPVDANAQNADAPRPNTPPADVDPAPVSPVDAGPGGSVVDGGAQSGDPLQANGFGGALCRNTRLNAGLTARVQANCHASGTASAQAPLSHYGFDVHIDTGFAGVSSRTFAAAVQTLILTPLWSLLLWLVHAVIAALEWSYAIDLLDTATMSSVADALRSAQRTVTDPWLAALLAIAAVGVMFHGLFRRRIIDTVGQALAMLVMMLAGLWVIANPLGTVGEINRLVNDASLGTLAAVSTGDPARPAAGFADGLRTVFDSAIAAPWCYMEFGDVDWCRNPKRLDPDLVRTAGGLRGRIATGDQCEGVRPLSPGLCDTRPSTPSKARGLQVDLLGRADTNGELFLALPANSPERNAINDEDSLYRALCGTDDDDDCRGSTAEVAQWRTETGTWPRTGGLFLITIGIAGMVALLAFIGARLLGAALLGVVYLLLAPVAVLAPALGEGGRAAFRGWGARLLGALVAKLVYSVLLGIVLVVLGLLASMGSLGWWTQWLLIAGFWWIVFAHRHEVLRYAALGHHDTGNASLKLATGMIAARQAGRLATATGQRTGQARAHAAQRQRANRTRIETEREQAERTRLVSDSHVAGARRADHATRLLDAEDHDARTAVAPANEARLRALGLRRQHLARNLTEAQRVGDRPAALRAQARFDRVNAEIAAGENAIHTGRERVAQTDRARYATGLAHTARERADRETLLDHQATLRRGVPPGPRANPHDYRDYRRLAPLTGTSSDQYDQLAPAEQRKVRLTVDRQLAQHVADRSVLAAAHRIGADASDDVTQRPGARRADTPTPPPRRKQSPRERQFAAARHTTRPNQPAPERRERG